MLIIEVINPRQVVRKRIGRLGDKLIGKMIDAQSEVEKAIVQDIEIAFQEFGIEARILSVRKSKIESEKSLEMKLQVISEKIVRLKSDESSCGK